MYIWAYVLRSAQIRSDHITSDRIEVIAFAWIFSQYVRLSVHLSFRLSMCQFSLLLNQTLSGIPFPPFITKFFIKQSPQKCYATCAVIPQLTDKCHSMRGTTNSTRILFHLVCAVKVLLFVFICKVSGLLRHRAISISISLHKPDQVIIDLSSAQNRQFHRPPLSGFLQMRWGHVCNKHLRSGAHGGFS